MQDKGFKGTVSYISLLDVIQLYCTTSRNVKIRVKSRSDSGIICISGGKITHAETPSLRGEKAFYEILSWEEGKFDVDSLDDDYKSVISIDTPWEQLLLDAVRIIDEKKAQSKDITKESIILFCNRCSRKFRLLPEKIPEGKKIILKCPSCGNKIPVRKTTEEGEIILEPRSELHPSELNSETASLPPETEESDKSKDKQSRPSNFINRRNIIRTLICVLVVAVLVVATKHIMDVRNKEKEYLTLMTNLKVKGDQAYNQERFSLAKKYYERALYFGKKISRLPAARKIKTQITYCLKNDENLRKVSQGFVFIDGKWVSRKELAEKYNKAQKIKVETRLLLKRAAISFIEGNYEEAIKCYTEIINKCQNVLELGLTSCCISIDKVKVFLKRSILCDNLVKASKFLETRHFQKASLCYENAFKIAKEIKADETGFLMQLQQKTLEYLIEASKEAIHKGRIDDAKVVLDKALYMLSFKYISESQTFLYKKKIRQVMNELKISRITQLREQAKREALNGNFERAFELLMSAADIAEAQNHDQYVAKIAEDIKWIEQKKIESVEMDINRLCLNGQFEKARKIYYDELRKIKKLKLYQGRNLLHDTIKLLEEKIGQIDKAEKRYIMTKKEILHTVSKLIVRAKKVRNQGNYIEAGELLNKAKMIIQRCKFKNEPSFEAKLQDIENEIAETVRKQTIWRAQQVIRKVESSLKRGKLDTIEELRRQLVYYCSNNPWQDQELINLKKKGDFLYEIASNLHTYFADSVKMTASDFFGTKWHSRVELNIENASVKHAVVSLRNFEKNGCVKLDIKGFVDLYVESNERMGFFPLRCISEIDVCRNSESIVCHRIQCKEIRKKCSLCPEPITFGTP